MSAGATQAPGLEESGGRSLERRILAFMTARTGRSCVLVPSGRLAVYLALRTLLSPGGRLLMSPVTDDIVFFVVLAAGLRPVMAPVSPADGNIDPDAVPGAVWSSIDGVLTTNLYGLPDRIPELRRRCDVLGIPLIEDAAHAIESHVDGQPVGTFGEAAAFSLSKHVAASGGGVVALRDACQVSALEQLRDELLAPRGRLRRARDLLEPAAKQVVRALGMTGPALRAYRALGLDGRPGYRLVFQASALERAIATADGSGDPHADLDRFDSWVRVDRSGYRSPLQPLELQNIARGLTRLAEERARRVEGVARLRELDAVAPTVRAGPVQPLFRVPLLVRNRDRVRSDLERRGIVVGYIYDPPLDDYAGSAFTEASPTGGARWWAAHVLPVDPLQADHALDVLGPKGQRVSPASPPD